MANATVAATLPQSLTDRQRNRILCRAVRLGLRAYRRDQEPVEDDGPPNFFYVDRLQVAIDDLSIHDWQGQEGWTPYELAVVVREDGDMPRRPFGTPGYWMHQAWARRELLRSAIRAGTPQRVLFARQDAKALLRRYAAERLARRFA